MRVLALAAVCAVTVGCTPSAAQGGKLATQADSVSYIIGYKTGENLKRQQVPANPDVIASALRAGLAGTDPLMTDSVMQSVMMNFQAQMMIHQRQRDSVAGMENRQAGQKFLAENSSKPGVKTTPSGLQYKVLLEGTGPHPKATSVVTVHYKGTLLDGKEFDSSYKRGQPYTTALNQVIAAWTEGVQLMSAGAKYQFWVPSDIGYGPQGSPPDIPPNAVLVFEVELVSFK